MNRIRLLPEQVANQIAAGEVIERPASVVKELVENALDAQARRIVVEIQAGGRSLVRVSDDGVGMSRDDALLCLERHATSKILRAEDLAAIATMGFRGEALPSIASISRFVLTTRERDSESPEGTQVVISAGRILEVKAAASAPGTALEVRQLFFNLPARRKFLRTEETESAHIQHYLTLAALAFPDVAFTFLKDGRTVWQLPNVNVGTGHSSRLAALRERLRALHGAEEKLLAVDFVVDSQTCDELADEHAESTSAKAEPEAPLRLWGFIGAPGVSRATREDQHLFVNRRPVENRGLNFALLEGYHTSLMKGRYPVCCLFLEIDPAAVDVNIHPAKREVRFRSEAEVRRHVAQAIRQTLLSFHSAETQHVPRAMTDRGAPQVARFASSGPPQTPGQTNLPGFPHELNTAASEASATAAQAPLPMGFGVRQSSGFGPGSNPAANASPLSAPALVPQTRAATPVSARASPPDHAPTPPPSPTNLSSTGAVPLLHVPLRLVGVIGKLYVVLESDRGLVLLDQHAAHERVLFEQMLNRLERSQHAHSQKLLLPETVELSARDANFLREQLPVLMRLGVGLSEFGERTFLLDALPPFVKVAEPRRFVLQILDELKAAGQEVNSLRLGEQMVAKTVCRHAVKANDPLSGPELENLIANLRHCAMPYTCPHGRPTLVEMNFRELEKKFGRSQ
jgi:DNA mismatch repair protein MutL